MWIARLSGRMFIRVQPVKYARGMNNVVTIAYTQVVPAVLVNKHRKISSEQ